MALDDTNYVDPFSNAAAGAQVGSPARTKQVNTLHDATQIGAGDIIGSSHPEILSEKFQRWAPKQTNASNAPRQYGGFDNNYTGQMG